MNPQPFWIGTAPFCSPDPSQCEKTPGFKKTGEDKCGDGACCWSGKKMKCEFDQNAWRETSIFKETGLEYYPEFAWFGTAPFCGGEACDAFMAGYLPIKKSKCGDGSCCATGDKWLGFRPQTKEQKDIVSKGTDECWKLRHAQEETLKSGLNFGSNILSSAVKLIFPF